jgi:hypothetical protein
MSLLPGIAAASAAALLLNASYLVQHAGLSTAPVVRVSRPLVTMRALLASRTWVTGALLGYAGLALNTLALGLAPLSLVQSIVAAGLVVVALGAAWARRRRPGTHEIVAIALIVAALASLGVGSGGAPSGPPSAVALLTFETVAALAAGTLAWRRRRDGGPHRLGLVAGILYGATNAALAALLASGGAAGVVTVALVAGATVTAGGFFAFQRGLQSGPATGVVTLMTAGTNVVAILGGLLVMREPLGATPALAALHAGSFAFVVLAGLLAASELTRLAEPAAAPGTPMPAVLPRMCSAVPDRAG